MVFKDKISMKKKYNVIIAGAGPAGLMAAMQSAQHGLKTLLVEKKANICEALRTTVMPSVSKILYMANTSPWIKKGEER